MNRMMIWATALLLMVAGMAVSQEANAGLFNRNDCCQPKCCKPKREGLFAKMKAKRAAKDCCAPEPTCCEAAPVCCEAPAPAPCGCEAAPACGCAAAPAPCAVEVAVAAPCGCAAPVTTCGCEAAAPACGCETTNCNCLSRRQLRKANRKGQCCGAKAKSCNTCSAPVTTCGYEVAAPACGCEAAAAPCGCTGETIIETAPAAAEGEEAAPEAPSAT